MSTHFLMHKHINRIVHRMKYFLVDWTHVNKVQVISFTVYFWFHSTAAVALSEWKAGCCKGEEAVGVAAVPPLPHCQHSQFENRRLSWFIPVTEGNFCLARFSIPNRWDEDKAAREEVEQKLMSVSAVQCVCSRLGDAMNKSKFLFLSLSFSSPSLLASFFSLLRSCSIALLCSMRIVEGWSYLLAGSVCLRSAGKANAFPDIHGQYSCVVLWPGKQDYVAFQGWVLFRFLVFFCCFFLTNWITFFIK